MNGLLFSLFCDAKGLPLDIACVFGVNEWIDIFCDMRVYFIKPI
jgi:hypothetical protein